MSYCANCGVELDDGLPSCPLCGYNSANDQKAEATEQSELYPSDIILLYKKETRRHIWELSGIISFSGMAVCTIVDLVIKKSLTWSLYADTSIFASWIFLTLILLAFRKYFIIIPGFLFTVLSTLFLFNIFTPPVRWFYGIGLPITLALFTCVIIMTILWKVAHFKGFNILAFAFIILSAFCLVSEVFIDRFLRNTVDLKWSAIVAISVLPVALVLLFVHYRMHRGKRLDSYFHV